MTSQRNYHSCERPKKVKKSQNKKHWTNSEHNQSHKFQSLQDNCVDSLSTQWEHHTTHCKVSDLHKDEKEKKMTEENCRISNSVEKDFWNSDAQHAYHN